MRHIPSMAKQPTNMRLIPSMAKQSNGDYLKEHVNKLAKQAEHRFQGNDGA